MARYLSYKRLSYGLFTFANFCWYAIFDWSSTNRMKQLVTHFFHPELEFFVLDFIIDHSKPMRLSFCHVLSWFANITNSKPNTLYNRKILVILKVSSILGPFKSFKVFRWFCDILVIWEDLMSFSSFMRFWGYSFYKFRGIFDYFSNFAVFWSF